MMEENLSAGGGRSFEVFPQTLNQDLWVVGDRSREEGVPSRFGRETGMCPLIRLGNCRGRARDRQRERDGLSVSFPVRNCSIVTAPVSCSFYYFLFLIF